MPHSLFLLFAGVKWSCVLHQKCWWKSIALLQLKFPISPHANSSVNDLKTCCLMVLPVLGWRYFTRVKAFTEQQSKRNQMSLLWRGKKWNRANADKLSSKGQSNKTCGTSPKHGSSHRIGQLYQPHPYSCCTVGCWVGKWHSQHDHSWSDSSWWL